MDNSTKIEEMKTLVEKLNLASKAYYAQDREVMSNFEYDKWCAELAKMETETGIILANSPTVQVGYYAVEELPKEKHEKAMLSLGKTKNKEELKEWLKDQRALLSWKLDGLTVVLTYQEGKLAKAVTRGNGEIGEVVTNNVRAFRNIPLLIPYKETLILRGEAVITYSDFEKINEEIIDVEAKYKNPRNLCSGSVRQLNNEVTAARCVKFFAFSLVKGEGIVDNNSREKQLQFLMEQGFSVVDYAVVDTINLLEQMDKFEKKVDSYDMPSDGLVLVYDDITYGESLGSTSKFPRDSMAFKWEDEVKETILTEIEWSPSRTGLINPVAIFEPVELEGTTVSRASVHNISILRALKLGIGDTITVYKANMIIPQIAENFTKSGTVVIPTHCPVCGGETKINQINDVQSLSCTNKNCAAKKIKSFSLFVSRNAMNIEGLSEATLEKFVRNGYVKEYADIFHLENYKEQIIEMEGFGEKSYHNLIHSIEVSKQVTLPRLLYSIGIANIGLANAKMICKQMNYSVDVMLEANREGLSMIDGIGEVIATAFCEYFENIENKERFLRLLQEVDLVNEEIDENQQTLTDMVFVITGSLHLFESRNALKEQIEHRGGKVTGSVTSKTHCLINNDLGSASSKNKKAKELAVPILTEEQFMEEFLGGNRNAN